MDISRQGNELWSAWKGWIGMGLTLCCLQAPSFAGVTTSPMRDCYQETSLTIYQGGDAKVQLPVRVNLLNAWVNQRFQAAAPPNASSKKASFPKTPAIEHVQLSKLWRKPKDFIATEKMAKSCLLDE